MENFIGLHTILISDTYDAVYSGLTPTYIQGQINKDEILIDLQRLCFNAGAIFIKDKIKSLDVENNVIFLENSPKINFDILSINTGSISKKSKIKIHDYANFINVKPISLFVDRIKKLDEELIENRKKKITVIGRGISGYEICFCLKQRYQNKIDITLIGTKELDEKNINLISKRKIKKISQDYQIKELTERVLEIHPKRILLSNGEYLDSEINILSTGASSPNWFKASFLEKDDEGFGIVNQNLLSVSCNNIFVTGDLSTINKFPRAKSGVIAVRQGEILKENIFLKLKGEALIKYIPQKNWLYIINTSDEKALVNYYFFSFHSKWGKNLKMWIDINFMKKFKFPNENKMNKKIMYLSNDREKYQKMYCQGCGSKVSKNTLVTFLEEKHDNLNLSDSSIVQTNYRSILQSIDHIKFFESMNPFDFGIISYLHSQNDILSGGGLVNSLSVSIGVPFSNGYIEKFYMNYFMKGIRSESDKDQSILASGHSYQSAEPGITITMNGIFEKKIDKNFAKENNCIYLSKPLGTGYLLSAYFNNSDLLSGSDFQKLVGWMKKGNLLAAKIAAKYESNVITDISGFGLASHLGDVCKSSKLSSRITLKDEILINKNIKILKKYQSTGFENNYYSSSKEVSISDEHPLKNILFDPQTNGPLLMSIKKENKNGFEKEFKKTIGFMPIFLGNFKKLERKLICIVN